MAVTFTRMGQPMQPIVRIVATSILVTALGVDRAFAGLVYSAFEDGSWKIRYQDTLDTEPRLVASEFLEDQVAARISPDGKHIAFERVGHGISVCVLRVSGSCRLLEVRGTPPVRPAWNAGSGELVFVQYSVSAHDEDSSLFATRDALSRTEPLLRQTGIQDYPDVSADGRYVVYSTGQTIGAYRGGVQVVQQLWTLDLAAGKARQVLAGTARDIHPRWSPDGATITFASDRSGQFEIWVMRTDDARPSRITGGEGVKTWPAWSPDGTEIIYTHSVDGTPRLRIIELANKQSRPFEPLGPGVQLRDSDWR